MIHSRLAGFKHDDIDNSCEAYVTISGDKVVYVCDDVNEAELTAWINVLDPLSIDKVLWIEYWDRYSINDEFKRCGARKIDGFTVATIYPQNMLLYFSNCCRIGAYPNELLDYLEVEKNLKSI
jgi:hypothetical protein